MTKRDCFFKTIRRELEGYIPFYFLLTPSQISKFKEKTGKDDYFDYYNMPIRFIPVVPKSRNVEFGKYFTHIDEEIVFDNWGIGHKKGSMEHFTQMFHPMEKFDTIEEFMDYPYPDPVNGFEWDAIAPQIEEVKAKDLISYSGAQGMGLGPSIFEIAWYLRGMDNFMIDLLTNPELACYHLDRITEIRCEGARRFAKADVDVIRLGDDVSTQLDMMISPETWKEFLKPRLKKVIDSAKETKPDILIDYHGDGNIQKIIPDLIEIGVDILNPVQPECMNPVIIKELYSDRLSFNGTVGTQTTMPFGTPEEVDRVCKEMIEKVGKGGGLILAPTHMIEPEVPWENIEAFLSAVKRYSKISQDRSPRPGR